MSLLNIFKISYYFDNNTGSTFTGFWVLVGLVVLLLIASVVLKRKPELVKIDRRVLYKMTRIAFIFSWIMLLWLFFRYEGVMYLSWRFWPAILILWVIYEKVLLYRFWKYELPARRSRGDENSSKEKYLRRFTRKGSKK